MGSLFRKPNRGKRTIPIGAKTADVLVALRPSFVDPTRLVLAKRDGSPLEQWNHLRKHTQPAAKKSGVSGVASHLLRHSNTTMLDVVGTPIGTMQSLSGHSAPQITREIYLHAVPEELRRAVNNVEKLMFETNLDPSSLSGVDAR